MSIFPLQRFENARGELFWTLRVQDLAHHLLGKVVLVEVGDSNLLVGVRDGDGLDEIN